MARLLRFAAIPLATMAVLLGAELAPAIAQTEALFETRRLTPNEYPRGIEGPAVDAGGQLYVVNYKRLGTIGRLAPGEPRSQLFAVLPAGSIANGIRFHRDGRMFVADYKKHNVFVFEPGQTEPRVYFSSPDFTQPNDLAIADDGTLYASDPNFARRSGRVWRIRAGQNGDALGEPMVPGRRMGVTNGIDLSPDGRTLYVSKSESCELWAYRLDGSKLVEPRLVRKFVKSSNSELDGLRTDIDGRVYVTRPGDGLVALVTPDGALVREIRLLGRSPTNLAFGGPDGQTLYVTQSDGGYVESFRVDRPGREYCQLAAGRCR